MARVSVLLMRDSATNGDAIWFVFGCLTRVSFVFNFFVIININLILGRCFFFFFGGLFLVLRIFRRSKWVMTHEFLCDY